MRHVSFDSYSPPMPIIDTTHTDVRQVAAQIKGWIQQ